MAASMLLPALGALALLGAGLVSDTGMLLVLEHAVMLPSMLAAMLLRRDEYTGHHQHDGRGGGVTRLSSSPAFPPCSDSSRRRRSCAEPGPAGA